jgi:hypothetical protein
MPVLSGIVQAEGALVDVVLGWSVRRAQTQRMVLQPVPPPANTRAILDTGAKVTCVDSSLIQTLNLHFAGTALANLPAHGGLIANALDDASLVIVHPSGGAQNNLSIRNLTVLGLPLAPLGYQVLIGRDVLASCRFFYHGPSKTFRLAY